MIEKLNERCKPVLPSKLARFSLYLAEWPGQGFVDERILLQWDYRRALQRDGRNSAKRVCRMATWRYTRTATVRVQASLIRILSLFLKLP